MEPRELLTTVVTNGVQVAYTNTVTSEQGHVIAIVVDFNPPLGLAPPNANVTFTVYSTNPSEGTPSVASLTFTPENSGNRQSIIVMGVNDAAPGVDDGHKPYGIAFGSMQSSDANYNGKSIAAVPLTNLDDDLKAEGSAGFTVPEDSPGVEINNTMNDHDLGGNGSWGHNVIWAVGTQSGQVQSGVRSLRTASLRPDADWYGPFVLTYSIRNGTKSRLIRRQAT